MLTCDCTLAGTRTPSGCWRLRALPVAAAGSWARRRRLILAAAEAAVPPAPAERSRPREALIKCADCDGTGSLAVGGYHKRNPLNQARLIGSKWTARERVLGWRHFTVREKRKTSVAVYALLVATCDPQATMWINIQNLRDRGLWAAGWLRKEQLQSLDQATTTCKTCGGSGQLQGYMSL